MNATFAPPWSTSGGYIVQPAAGAPPGMKNVLRRRVKANGSSQKLQLFRRGSAISGAPTIIGTSQFAKPTNAGMIAPKIMINACIVVNWLNRCGSSICSPGLNSSARMPIARNPPTKNMMSENNRYSVPMSL